MTTSKSSSITNFLPTMTTLPIPSALEQLVARAKASTPTATFSCSWKFDPALMEKVQGTITSNPASPASYMVTNNPDMVTQFAIALENTIKSTQGFCVRPLCCDIT
jgi:hypothetical protein